MTISEQVKAAKKAIDDIFSDQSVDWRVTLEAMEDLSAYAQDNADVLRDEHRDDL
jgi:hypothetical protein